MTPGYSRLDAAERREQILDVVDFVPEMTELMVAARPNDRGRFAQPAGVVGAMTVFLGQGVQAGAAAGVALARIDEPLAKAVVSCNRAVFGFTGTADVGGERPTAGSPIR